MKPEGLAGSWTYEQAASPWQTVSRKERPP
jgi:hypothetical protein